MCSDLTAHIISMDDLNFDRPSVEPKHICIQKEMVHTNDFSIKLIEKKGKQKK